MDENLMDLGKYIKYFTQVLLIDFNFTEKDVFKLFNCVEELSNSSLIEYLERRR